jgi:hypothetical protein
MNMSNIDEYRENTPDNDIKIQIPFLHYLIEANNIGLLNSLKFNGSLEKLKEFIYYYKNGNEYSKYYLKCLLVHFNDLNIQIPQIELPKNFVTLYKNKYRYHNDKSIINIKKIKFNIGFSENSITIPELQRELNKFNIKYEINENKNILYRYLIDYMIKQNLLYIV